MVIVKKLGSKDISSVQFIVENLIDEPNLESYDKHLISLLNDPNTYLYAAILEGEIIGYALAYKFPLLYSPDFTAYLYDIDVVEIHQRKGAGRMLLDGIMKQLKMEDVYELWLGTAINNEAGQAFFKAAGGVRSKETFNDFTFVLS